MIRFVVSLCLLVSWALAQPPAQTGGGGQDMMSIPEIFNYTLTMDKVDKWAAANRAWIPYFKSHTEQLKAKPDPKPGEIKTMDEMVRWTKAKAPEYVRIIESAGITLKEYFIMGIAISSALAAASMMERGVQPPPGTHINQANAAFAKANKAKLTAMFTELQQMYAGHKL
jgi:hypothetical protein